MNPKDSPYPRKNASGIPEPKGREVLGWVTVSFVFMGLLVILPVILILLRSLSG